MRGALTTLKLVGLSLLAGAALVTSAAAATPPADSQYRSVATLLAERPKLPMHIVYVHGIRASSPGFSDSFRGNLCAHLPGGCVQIAQSRRYLNLGDTPPPGSYVGRPIWTDASWKASRPFVEHYVFKRPNASPVVVDEINYWPLLLGLKCQFLIDPDASLTGPDKADIEVCANQDKTDYLYPWFDQGTEQRLLKTQPPLGGGAWINGLIKTYILNWGLSDAVVALGPMKNYTRRATWCAFEEIASFDVDAPTANQPPRSCRPEDNAIQPSNQQFVVITESLGSFVLLDAFADATYDFEHLPPNTPLATRAGAALRFVVQRSDNIYFFANQFALLELARIQGVESGQESRPAAVVANALRDWASSSGPGEVPRPRQLIAFNDPSDILTYNVPDFCVNAPADRPCRGTFNNIYVRNSFGWFGLFERPDYAHTWYSRNPKVLKTILGQ